jgi:hypothetical protein
MIRIEDIGEIAYGGAVTLAEWWDNKRIAAGTITSKDVIKKASFYTYFGIGLVATLASAFGWMNKAAVWEERLATGFLYDLPRVGYNLAKAMSATAGRGGSGSAVVEEAQRILREKQMATNRLLADKAGATGRSYQLEMESAKAF